MDIFTHLNNAIDHEHTNGELPDNLVAPLRLVSRDPNQFATELKLVEKLTYQLKAFEPYCDCGCFAEGFNAKDIRKTLAQLGVKMDE